MKNTISLWNYLYCSAHSTKYYFTTRNVGVFRKVQATSQRTVLDYLLVEAERRMYVVGNMPTVKKQNLNAGEQWRKV